MTRKSRTREEILKQAKEDGLIVKGGVLEVCQRCGGSGHFSYNTQDGTMCYGCRGLRFTGTISEDVHVRRAQGRDRREFNRRAEVERAEAARDARRDTVPASMHEAAVALGHTNALSLADNYVTDGSYTRMALFVQDMVQRHLSDRTVTEKQQAYLDRIPEIMEERAAKDAQCVEAGHYGTIDERFDVEARLFFARELDTQWGTTTMAKFETPEGHILVWFASGYRQDMLRHECAGNDQWSEARKGTVRLTGTVKKHDSYQGSPQTVITRCKLEWVEEDEFETT